VTRRSERRVRSMTTRASCLASFLTNATCLCPVPHLPSPEAPENKARRRPTTRRQRSSSGAPRGVDRGVKRGIRRGLKLSVLGGATAPAESPGVLLLVLPLPLHHKIDLALPNPCANIPLVALVKSPKILTSRESSGFDLKGGVKRLCW